MICLLVMFVMLVVGCSEEVIEVGASDDALEHRETHRELPSYSSDWQSGSYLTFSTEDEYRATIEHLRTLQEGEGNQSDIVDDCQMNPALDVWENDHSGFESLRRYYERYDCEMLGDGLDPSYLMGEPVIDDAIGTTVNVDGLVQIGDYIYVEDGHNSAKAPVGQKSRLKQIIEDGAPIRKTDLDNGIEFMPPSTTCSSNFSIQLNHLARTVLVDYTGTSPSSDVTVTWSVDGVNDPADNTTAFSHTYDNADKYTICATVTVRELVTETFTWVSEKEMEITDPKTGNTNTVIVEVKNSATFETYKIVCTDQVCKEIDLTVDCFAGFDYVVGIDNVVSFVNLSSVQFGNITSVQWIFGDGNTSTEMNPSHTYECDREYQVILIIYSDLCPEGQAISSPVRLTATGLVCCDRNPKRGWTDEWHPTDAFKKIRWAYDMSTTYLTTLLDEDFKAKIQYFEYREGGLWGNRTKWWKTKTTLDVNVNGSVYANDEDQCRCQLSRDLVLSPAIVYDDGQATFKDEFGSGYASPGYRMKQGSDVVLDYYADGLLYISVVCQDYTGFNCETSD